MKLAGFLLLIHLATVHSNSPVSNCCLKTSDTVREVRWIKEYMIQRKGVCPVDAVIFFTIKNRTICSDPSQDWVKTAMKALDEKKKVTATTGQRSTTKLDFVTDVASATSPLGKTSSPKLVTTPLMPSVVNPGSVESTLHPHFTATPSATTSEESQNSVTTGANDMPTPSPVEESGFPSQAVPATQPNSTTPTRMSCSVTVVPSLTTPCSVSVTSSTSSVANKCSVTVTPSQALPCSVTIMPSPRRFSNGTITTSDPSSNSSAMDPKNTPSMANPTSTANTVNASLIRFTKRPYTMTVTQLDSDRCSMAVTQPRGKTNSITVTRSARRSCSVDVANSTKKPWSVSVTQSTRRSCSVSVTGSKTKPYPITVTHSARGPCTVTITP